MPAHQHREKKVERLLHELRAHRRPGMIKKCSQKTSMAWSSFPPCIRCPTSTIINSRPILFHNATYSPHHRHVSSAWGESFHIRSRRQDIPLSAPVRKMQITLSHSGYIEKLFEIIWVKKKNRKSTIEIVSPIQSSLINYWKWIWKAFICLNEA